LDELVRSIQESARGLAEGTSKQCPICEIVKPLEAFRDIKLASGFGRHCLKCKTSPKLIPHSTKIVTDVFPAARPEKGPSFFNRFLWGNKNGNPSAQVRTSVAVKPTVQSSETKCPRCHGQMILRERRSDGSKFFGCSRFPRCRGVRNL